MHCICLVSLVTAWLATQVTTCAATGGVYAELYDLRSDVIERNNVGSDPENQSAVRELSARLHKQQLAIRAEKAQDRPQIPATAPQPPRTDLFISGVYPHLTTYGVYSQNGAHYKSGHNECGIGALVPWAGRLWMVNYAPHMPKGSEHKLFSVDPDPGRPLRVHPESVGGTPAGRMIHAESKQLLIGHHLIDANGKVRTISPRQMPIRVTAIARHLTDPANRVYYIDMEGSIWEADVHTLETNRLFKKPVPGWHSKGGYTSQGRLVVSNNGELHVGNYDDVLVGGEAASEEERGVLAEFDGEDWRIVERRQYTEVTGPRGLSGGSDGDEPIWAVGWDRRSVRLKLLEDGQWHTYLLPKAAYCNDASHGWYTEWPRIREITDGRWMLDMHGMFFDFPPAFSVRNSAGIKPIGSHLRYIPDFCDWNGTLVLATDETSIQGNKLAGQPQSNLWFGTYDDLKTWGPASGYGGPWIEDEVEADTPSDPFLIAGFDRRVLHLAVGRKRLDAEQWRTTDQQRITSMPDALSVLPRVSRKRGNWRRPAPGYEFDVDEPVTVYLAVDRRGQPRLDPGWQPTELTLTWGKGFRDVIYRRDFPAGEVIIPGNSTEHTPGSYGLPHTAFVETRASTVPTITPRAGAAVTTPVQPVQSLETRFHLQVDREGDGTWTDLETVTVPASGYVAHGLPANLRAVWLRLSTDRDCVATAFLHQTTSRFPDGTTADNAALFSGLADVGTENTLGATVYAAKRNRNLRVVTDGDRFFDFTKTGFEFERDKADPGLQKLLHVEPEFTVDEASVILKYQGKNLRLPKGDPGFDRPFPSGWPRSSREVQSERHLANIHGTFYEVPLVTNGAPPAWNLMRPVSSHSKQITDFCSWNGLLVLAGVRSDAPADSHVFRDADNAVGLWFGGIDDLWKLGKPVGHGGPWLNSTVKAGVPSDPYLMKGYDRKSASISQASTEPVTVTLQVDIDGTGLWVDYRSLQVPPRERVTCEFPVSFSACWIRAISDRDAVVTLQLEYR